MKKFIFALTLVLVTASSTVFATPVEMTVAEMDKVVAGQTFVKNAELVGTTVNKKWNIEHWEAIQYECAGPGFHNCDAGTLITWNVKTKL
jgi:hypothetical protein